MASEDLELRRRFVAWLGHAPGLWLFYREPLPAALRWPNAVAALATIAAITATAIVATPSTRPWWCLIAWAIGHVLWGSYLAIRLPRRRP